MPEEIWSTKFAKQIGASNFKFSNFLCSNPCPRNLGSLGRCSVEPEPNLEESERPERTCSGNRAQLDEARQRKILGSKNSMIATTNLQKFDPKHADDILNWVTSMNEAVLWASLTNFPLHRDLFQRWHTDPDVHPFQLSADGILCAYGELWLEEEEGTAELARLIVAPNYRRRGVGRSLINALLREAHSKGFEECWLRVNPANIGAMQCYFKCGFELGKEEQQIKFNDGQPQKYQWMVHHSKERQSTYS